MHTEDDYAQELVAKWASLGHLNLVNPDDKTRVASRLEGAHRRTMGTRPEKGALEDELARLRHEGYMGPAAELQRNHAVRSGPWPDKNSPRREQARSSSSSRQGSRTSRSRSYVTGIPARTATG